MPGLIDTNILLYAANEDAPQHERAISFLTAELSTSDAWYLTEGIVYEFLRVSTHARIFENPLTWQQSVGFLEPILSRDNVTILTASTEHWSMLRTALTKVHHPAGNLFFDIRTYVLMLEHSVKSIYTADTDFLQFSEVDVINPILSVV